MKTDLLPIFVWFDIIDALFDCFISTKLIVGISGVCCNTAQLLVLQYQFLIKCDVDRKWSIGSAVPMACIKH